MLVRRVDVIHIVLHLRHNASEIAHELPEHTRFIQAPQCRLRIFLGRQHTNEESIRIRILLHRFRNPTQAPRDEMQRVWMDIELMSLGDFEEPEHLHRSVVKMLVACNIETTAFDFKIFNFAGE